MMLANSPNRGDSVIDSEDEIERIINDPNPPAPVKHDEEWANALTHGLAAVTCVVGGGLMVWHTADESIGTTLSCLAFVFSATGVFVASTLSHVYLDDPVRLKHLRAWDQGLIYGMISGTYTPIIYQFADPQMRAFVLIAIWVAAFVGFYSKVFAKHRINGIGTATYLALGWLPALFLVGRVPYPVLVWMSVGGVIYTLGVAVLLNDSRVRYMHAVWHLLVITAASCHYWAIFRYVVGAGS
jgi:hemolysin III